MVRETGAIQWLGADRELQLQGEVGWPASGKLTGKVRSLDFSLVSDFLDLPSNALNLAEANFSADWTNGPAKLSLELAAMMTREGIPFAARANLRGDGQGISL